MLCCPSSYPAIYQDQRALETGVSAANESCGSGTRSRALLWKGRLFIPHHLVSDACFPFRCCVGMKSNFAEGQSIPRNDSSLTGEPCLHSCLGLFYNASSHLSIASVLCLGLFIACEADVWMRLQKYIIKVIRSLICIYC